MTIRNVDLADKEAIGMLSNQINQDHYENMPNDFRKPQWSDKDWQHWLTFSSDERGVFLVAVDGESVVGFIAGRVIESGKSPHLISKTKFQISAIVVDKYSRGRGVGKALVKSGLAVARDLGATEVFLEVMAYNIEAQKFYESLGFGQFSSKLSMQLPGQPDK